MYGKVARGYDENIDVCMALLGSWYAGSAREMGASSRTGCPSASGARMHRDWARVLMVGASDGGLCC